MPCKMTMTLATLLLIIGCVKCQRQYRLFQQPLTIYGPETLSSRQILGAIQPQKNNLLIVYTLAQSTAIFGANFRMYENGLLADQSQYFYWDQKGFIGAFWVCDQYLLVVWKSLTLIYRPPLYGWEAKRVISSYNGTIIKCSVVKSYGKDYLIVIENSTNLWMMKKYEFATDNQVYLNLVNSTQFPKGGKLQELMNLINIKDFHCMVVKITGQSDRMYGYNFNINDSFFNYSIGEFTYSSQAEPQTNNIFLTIKRPNNLTLRKYSVSQDGKTITHTFAYEVVTNDFQVDFYISKNKIMLFFNYNGLEQQAYVQILQQNETDNYFTSQYLSFDQHYEAIMPVGKENDKDLTLLGIQLKEKRYGIVYAKYITQQSNIIWLIIICTLLFLLLIYTVCRTFIHFKTLSQFSLIQRIHTRLLVEVFLVFLVHAGIFLMTIQTNTSENGSFKQSPQRSTSPDSFELRMFQMMFYFTALVSVLLEGSSEFKAKSTYLGFLVKHGLKTNFYFNYKQQLLLIRGILYGLASTGLFSFLESRCSPQFRLYPSIEQLTLIASSYALCLYSLYNMAYIFVYLCKNYWYFVQLFISTMFFFSFITDQFYLNKSITFEEKTFACISPISFLQLFSQQVFKTQIRFNNRDVSSAFLLVMSILQSLTAFLVFQTIFFFRFKMKSLQNIMKKSTDKNQGAINQSEESQSIELNMEESGLPLLRVFIPCKLSTNEGFEKINILRNIRFTGKRGEVLTFLDSQNISKRTLFNILVNNQQSDKNIERDLDGSVCYNQRVKISMVLEDSPFFADLTAIERLQLISRLRQPSISIQQQKRNIDFILNQFNIADQFKTMKSRELSGGSLKKIALACAFIGNPDVVILDQPTLGLDIRFRNIFHRKLREWKDGKLIIIGTSDHAEADAVSDRLWALQNGKAIDLSIERDQRLMTSLKMCFIHHSDFNKISKFVGIYFKDHKIVLQEQQNQSKQSYKIHISIFSKGLQSQQLIRQFMKQLNVKMPLNNSSFYINFIIADHPYDYFSFKPFKEDPTCDLNEFTSRDIQMFHINNVFEEDQDQLIDESYQFDQENQKKNNISRLMNFLKKSEEYQLSFITQIKGIIYLYYSLWKGSQLSYQFLIVSIYCWVHYIFLSKMKRMQESFDFINLLIKYCLLHFSLVELRLEEIQLTKGLQPRVIVIATWLYDCTYLFVGFFLNNCLQTIIIDSIIFERSDFQATDKLVCSFLFIACYTLFVSILVKIIKQRKYVLIVLLLTHICLLQASFNSFVYAYPTDNITVGTLGKYFFYPLTAMALYDSFLSNRLQYWGFIEIFIIQAILLYFLLIFLLKPSGKPERQLPKDYSHAMSQATNEQQVLVQNIENKDEVPFIGDNLIHFYAKIPVLSNIYLKINKGEVYGLLGHNGCGKTTALSIIAGRIIPTHGKLFLFGEQVKKQHTSIGYCSQQGLLLGELTVEQNIRAVGSLKGLRANYVSKYIIKLLRYFKLRGIQQVRAKYLSASQKKKVSLIVALLGFPKLLLLDEVTGGIDPEGRRRILNLIKAYNSELGGTVLMVSHEIAETEEICDHISVLKDGVLRKAGALKCLRSQQQHDFSLLNLNFARGTLDIILGRQKALVKEYVQKLIYVRLQNQDRLTLAYSLDIKKIDMLEVWEKVYEDFFIGGIVEKFSLRRHSLPEIVKQSIVGGQPLASQQWQDQIRQQGLLQERLI